MNNPYYLVKKRYNEKKKKKNEVNTQRQRKERLAQLEETQNQSGRRILHPVKAQKERKEIKALKTEIALFEKRKKDKRILIVALSVLVIIFIIVLTIILTNNSSSLNNNSSPSTVTHSSDFENDINSEKVSTEQTENKEMETITDSLASNDDFEYQSILESYDMVITSRLSFSSRAWIYYYMDFDSGIATHLLVQARKTDDTKRISQIYTIKITGDRDDGWQEVNSPINYKVEKIDGKEMVVEYNYKGDKAQTFFIREIDEYLDILYDYFSDKDYSLIKRALIPEE